MSQVRIESYLAHPGKGKIRIHCKRCPYHFSLTTDTIFEKSSTPLSKWILAIGLFKVGISAHQLKEEVNGTHKTAWKMLNMIRSCISHGQLLDKLKGRGEVDDTYFGGHQKGKRDRRAAYKTSAVGIKGRGEKVRSIVLPAVKSPALREIIKTHITTGSVVYTDKWHSYRRIRHFGHGHKGLDRQKGFARGRTHTQGIESYCSHVKPDIVVCYRRVSPQLNIYRPICQRTISNLTNGTTEILLVQYYLKMITLYPLMG